ncbi:hypothetical protein CPB83DRAFT_112389 [Crepidotus variabilis]|uniref:RING-type E3 ubiquitin transferase n=1 Tax=Crepidotus variabilis TaxID=179855 RepID=A0A9P6E4R8_9AGAR|nr:hypothetical protein CPB83DRAFT_112389 [Crepidotus variabilis]
MQDFDDLDTCRICSAPAEPDQPLFHPCKCSGTIRYIHQDCLTTWLAHSKKKACDVCKHPYYFTKVYAPDMPSSLPPFLLFRRLIQHLFFGFLLLLRGIAVVAIWLGFLPWVTVWTWRMYFSMGETTAWWISDRPKPPTSDTPPFFNRQRVESPVPPPSNIILRVTTHPVYQAISADIFTGQIIASLIVLTFVAVFLLREWISQNARPGVFEEEEPIPDEAQPQPAQPDNRPPPRLVFPANPQRRPLPPLPPVQPVNNQMHPRMDALAALEVPQIQRQPFNADDAVDPDRWALDDEAQNRRPRKKKAKAEGEEDENEQIRKRVDEEEVKRRMFHRRILNAKAAAARRRNLNAKRAASASPTGIPAPGADLPVPNPAPNQPAKFEFTFNFNSGATGLNAGPSQITPFDPSASTQSLPTPPLSTSLPSLPSRPSSTQPSSSFSLDSPFPTVALEPPSSAVPFSLRPWEPQPPPGDPPGWPTRPPLPTITLPGSGTASPFIYSPGRTPLESPSLSTYRAPEELEAELNDGPSEYFSGQDLDKTWSGDDEYDDDSIDYDQDQTPSPMRKGKKPQVVEGANGLGRPGRHNGRSLPDSDEERDMRMEHDRFFVDRPTTDAHPTNETLSDSDSAGSDDDNVQRPLDLVDGDEEDEDEDEQPEGMFRFEDDDDAWEDVDGEAVAENVVVIEAGAPLPEGQIPLQPQLQGAGAANPPAGEEGQNNQDPADEADANVEDDMEGALEAIGMRGPIFGVFQNAALMIFVLDTAIGVCIWIPFTIGKTTALLTLDPHRMLQVLHLPIRGMRLITDPIVDLVALIVVGLLLPWVMHVGSGFLRFMMMFGSSSFGKVMSPQNTNHFWEMGSRLVNQTSEFIAKPMDLYTSWISPSEAISQPQSNFSNATSLLESIPDHLGPLEPLAVALGAEVREALTAAQSSWIRLALGSGPSNRAFAIILGYAVVTFVFCLYLNLLTVGNARTAGSAVRNAVRQQLLVLKVAAFIVIELVIFPLGCGIVLDLCTVWLFPEANLHTRIAFFSQAPLTAMFYHWVAGTMFMYTFAVLLSGCRSVMRAGAMWFIKDPQDQNSHPIRDILDRPTLVQLRKIFISGLMYSFVVACVVGSVAGLLLMGSKSIMPFRWKNREPLSNVPVDLLFLHLVLPYTMLYFRPKRAIKEVATIVWKFLATRLRLNSYFFGGRHPQEEFTPKDWRDNFFRSDTFVADPDTHLDGSFRRVPATDNLALPRDMRATVAVTAEGIPLDDAASKLMALQNIEAEKARRNVNEDYMIVYIPPNFRWRIITFIVLLWIVGAVFVGFAVAVPLSLGRSFFKLFTMRDVHDGYSFIIGFYLNWFCYLTARAIDRLDRRRKRRNNGDGPRAELGLLVAKRGLLWLAKTIYMAFFLGVVIPILLAIVIDLYIVLPVRLSFNPDLVPRIRIVDQWALGLLYAKMAMYTLRLQPQTRISRGLQHIIAHGFTRPDPVTATREIIVPLVGGLLGMIILPGIISRTAQHYFPIPLKDKQFIFLHVYPFVFIFASTIRSAAALYKVLRAWSLAIRDKEFLVEMRLKNHEAEAEEREKRNRAGGMEADPGLREAAAAVGGVVDVGPVPPLDAPVMQAHLIDPHP